MVPNPSSDHAPAGNQGVVVWIPSLLRDLTGGLETVRVSGANVRQVIAALDQSFPGIQARLCSGGNLRPGIAVAVNTQVAPLGLLQAVAAGSEIHFLPAVAGG
jgi:molybdopterin converting factor small subunit